LAQDLEESLKQVEALPPSEDLPPDVVTRRELARGRLLALSGKPEEAIQALTAGLRSFRAHAFEFELALGEANRVRGALNVAEKHYENALRLNRQSEDAKEGLGRVLLARDLERDLLARIPAQPDSRRVSLVRGIAFAQMADWKRARAELTHTQVNGKYPSEAVIYLSMADAAQGQSDRAVEILEKTLAMARRARGEIRVALGKIYWERGALDKARAQLEEASKESFEYEGPCSLGRLLEKLGLRESAVAPLSQAVARNPFHREARYALAHVLLDLGRAPEALKLLESAPDGLSAVGERDKALALYYSGRFKEAETSIQAALKLASDDAEAHRIHASALFALGDSTRAMKALVRANRIDSEDPRTFCEIGRGFLRQNNTEMAQKAFDAAKARKANLPCAVAGEHLSHLGSESRSSAVKEINESLQTPTTAGERAFAVAALARLKLQTGNPAEARKLGEESVRLSPFEADGHLALGLVASKLREETMARASLQKAAELDPESAGAHLALADFFAHGNAEDIPNAISEYETFLRLSQGPDEENRVKRALSNLKKKVAAK
jgi:tetratricopeptide (TPR) repeat protein